MRPIEVAAAARVLTVVAVAAVAALSRLLDLTAIGFNSDEAVYVGQAGALAGNPHFAGLFPVFRAHPLLVQAALSLLYRTSGSDAPGREFAAAIGVATVVVVYLLGRELYNHRTGVLGALLLAVMPYHVLVTRQVLLDGPMTLLATVTLLLIARYATTSKATWLIAAVASFGLTTLAKETSVVLLGSAYVFFALAVQIRLRLLPTLFAAWAYLSVVLVYPVTLALAGHSSTGKSYLTWQLLRRSNHAFGFYGTTVTLAVGPVLLVAAAAGLWWARRTLSWRETLLLAWVAVPVAFFQIWPVKGYQYLLPIAPALAVLAARAVDVLPLGRLSPPRARVLRAGTALAVVASLAYPTAAAVADTTSTSFLAGTGGVPGGRETGQWLTEHVPVGGKLLTLGPSMANILEFYGHRVCSALSVSSNPLHRNPAYDPVINPDAALRTSEFQYVVWDRYSAERSPFFARLEHVLVQRYHGRVVHVTSVRSGGIDVPVIVIYAVHP